MSWNVLGESFTKLLEHLETNQKRSQAMIDTWLAVAQTQQAYSVRLQGVAEQHEKKYFGSIKESEAEANANLQPHKSFTSVFTILKSESTAAKNSFEMMNSAIGALKGKQAINADDIRKLKVGYEDKTSDLKLKLKEARKLEKNLDEAVAEKKRITDLQNAKKKSSFFKSSTHDRQKARAKELICREEYTKQVYIYNDNRKHIFGDFLPKLCEKAEEVYRKQIIAIEECRCATNQTFQFTSMEKTPAADAEEDLQRIFRTFSSVASNSDFPELELPAETNSSGSKSEVPDSGFGSGEKNGTVIPGRRMTLGDETYAEPKKVSSSSLDFGLSAYELIDTSPRPSFLTRGNSIKLTASQPPPPPPPNRCLRKFVALYNYNGQDAEGFEVDNALAIHENDKLTEEPSDGTDDGWMMVRDEHNDVGMVPLSYLREVFDPCTV